MAWPTLTELCVRAGKDARIMEQTCRALRLAVKGAQRAAAPLLPALKDALAIHFQATHQPAFL